MSAAVEPPVAHPLTVALTTLQAAVDETVAVASPGPGGQLWTVPERELLQAVGLLHRLGCSVDAAVHGMVREVDARGAATAQGAPSTQAWLRERLHLHPGAAKRLVTTARGLHDDPSGALVHHAATDQVSQAVGRPVLAAAFAAGDISGGHAAVAVRVLDGLPDKVEDEIVDQAEAYLAAEAARRDPVQLARLGRHLAHVLDPDAGDRLGDQERDDQARQELHIRRRDDAGADLRGRLSAETTAALLAALQPLAAPRPSTDGRADPRTMAQRNADALAELLRRYGAGGLGPTSHGAKATISVAMCLETLEKRLGASAATLGWGGLVSAETARRLACDARVIPVLLAGTGEPLDVGRASYPVTQAIWRALVARDGGCSFDTCGRPPEWTEAHHVVHWGDGGETCLPNCVLFCDHHHRVVHHDGWVVTIIDGVVHVIPPPWIDPHRQPRPNQHPDRGGGRSDLHDLPTSHPPDRE